MNAHLQTVQSSRGLIGGLLFLCLLLASGSLSAVEVSPQVAQEQEQKLQALRERIDRLKQQSLRSQGKRSALQKALQSSEKTVGQAARKLRVLKGRVQRQQNRLQTLATEQAAQQQTLQDQRTLLARQIQAAHAMGRQDYLKVLLNQQQPSQVMRALTYYQYINQARLAQMQAIETQLQSIEETRQTLNEQTDRLQLLEDEQQAELLSLRQAQAQRQQVLAKLSREISDQNRQLGDLRQNEQQLQQLLKGIEEALAEVPEITPIKQQPFVEQRGLLHWPTAGRLQHVFGEAKVGRLRWDGVMISAPEGKEVKAVHAGRVAFADWLRGFGLLIIVDHGDGYMTLYGHNQSLFKEAGESVVAGEPIAAVGDTGGQQSSGVYFAIRRNGKAVNPQRWCRLPKGNKVSSQHENKSDNQRTDA